MTPSATEVLGNSLPANIYIPDVLETDPQVQITCWKYDEYGNGSEDWVHFLYPDPEVPGKWEKLPECDSGALSFETTNMLSTIEGDYIWFGLPSKEPGNPIGLVSCDGDEETLYAYVEYKCSDMFAVTTGVKIYSGHNSSIFVPEPPSD